MWTLNKPCYRDDQGLDFHIMKDAVFSSANVIITSSRGMLEFSRIISFRWKKLAVYLTKINRACDLVILVYIPTHSQDIWSVVQLLSLQLVRKCQ